MPGRERAANEKRQRGSKLSNKQEKAKGKAQESRHQNRFPPLFLLRDPLTVECNRSRGFVRASGQSRLITFISNFSPEGFWFHFGKGGGAG